MNPIGPPNPVPNSLDFQGERDERTWVMRERMLEEQLAEVRSERDHLRLMLELALSRERSE